MNTLPKKLTAALLVALLSMTLVAAPALAAGESQDYSADAMIADAVFLRPLGLVATCLGGAVWVVSLPFSLVAGNAGEAADKLVADPLRYTFKRPLGQID